jgi:hypothetical protein
MGWGEQCAWGVILNIIDINMSKQQVLAPDTEILPGGHTPDMSALRAAVALMEMSRLFMETGFCLATKNTVAGVNMDISEVTGGGGRLVIVVGIAKKQTQTAQ